MSFQVGGGGNGETMKRPYPLRRLSDPADEAAWRQLLEIDRSLVCRRAPGRLLSSAAGVLVFCVAPIVEDDESRTANRSRGLQAEVEVVDGSDMIPDEMLSEEV